MLIQARWDEMRQKMQVVKNAYISRHYTQCAKYGERLLAEVQGGIHPIHLAYLNFYTALSHDTLAREATLKNRYKELSLAEKHYMAAIAALTPSSSSLKSYYGTTTQDHSPSSSTSSTCSSEVIWKFRRPSTATSFASSSSSLDFSHRGLGSFSFPQPPRSPSPTTNVPIPSRPSTPEEYQFAADTAAFVRMVRTHLADVQMLKGQTSAPAVRFFSNPSPAPSRATSRVWDEKEGDEVKEKVRRERVGRTWRKRFDPSEVQRLCAEAEAELN